MCIRDRSRSATRAGKKSKNCWASATSPTVSYTHLEPVCVQHINAEGVKITRDGGIEARTTSDQVAHTRTERRMNLAEENFTCVDSEPPESTIECHQRAHQTQSKFAAFIQLFENLFVNQIEELRDDAERSDVALLQGCLLYTSRCV